MKKFVKFLLAAFTILAAYLVAAPVVGAYQYPIFELGNCRDQKECHTYCEVPAHHPVCWSYSVYGARVLADETPETHVAQLGITFPVAELGNCANLQDCKIFCSQVANHDACQKFSQSHGLRSKERIIEKAKQELGCATYAECQAFCSQAANKDACEAFTKRYHLKAEVKDKIADIAKQNLGCATVAECRALCSQPENRVKCQQVSQKLNESDTSHREQLVEKAKTELGCTSFADCKAFCQNEANRDKCRNFGQAVRNENANKMRDLKEKLGCTTAEDCRKACEANPDKCPAFPKRPQSLPSGIQPGPLKRLYSTPGSSSAPKISSPNPEPIETDEVQNETP